MAILETIKVKHKDGYMLINKKDFNKEEHEEYNIKSEEPKQEEAIEHNNKKVKAKKVKNADNSNK